MEDLNIDIRIVAFIDILGFQTLINDFENGNTNILSDLYNAIENAINALKPIEGFDSDEMKKWKEELDIRTFSDCICISITTDSKKTNQSFLKSCRLFFQYLGLLHKYMLELGDCYLIRGGVSIGNFYSTNNFLFSQALVDAYILESKKASVPRILIHQKLIDKIKAELNTDGAFSISSYPLITRFEDNLPFINFFNIDLVDAEQADKILSGTSFEKDDVEKKHNDIILYISRCKSKLEDNPGFSQDAINKYQWFIRFANREASAEKANPQTF